MLENKTRFLWIFRREQQNILDILFKLENFLSQNFLIFRVVLSMDGDVQNTEEFFTFKINWKSMKFNLIFVEFWINKISIHTSLQKCKPSKTWCINVTSPQTDSLAFHINFVCAQDLEFTIALDCKQVFYFIIVTCCMFHGKFGMKESERE